MPCAHVAPVHISGQGLCAKVAGVALFVDEADRVLVLLSLHRSKLERLRVVSIHDVLPYQVIFSVLSLGFVVNRRHSVVLISETFRDVGDAEEFAFLRGIECRVLQCLYRFFQGLGGCFYLIDFF